MHREKIGPCLGRQVHKLPEEGRQAECRKRSGHNENPAAPQTDPVVRCVRKWENYVCHTRIVSFTTDFVVVLLYNDCFLFRIEGGELFERVIDDDFILTEKSCTIFMRQICEGVDFMHKQRILHLDMKVRPKYYHNKLLKKVY